MLARREHRKAERFYRKVERRLGHEGEARTTLDFWRGIVETDYFSIRQVIFEGRCGLNR
jgi:hypothetical protein